MPLTILLPIVVLGIAGIAILLHLTGHSAPVILRDAAQVRREWARHFPADPPDAVWWTPEVALVRLSDGFGLLGRMGADTVAHRLARLEPAPGGLRAGFADFAFPDRHLTLSDSQRDEWLAQWRNRHA
ncbi:MAG: hypothetical protein R3D60_07770 [Paracoccaceae bacterium]